ncbi:MAG TPA: anti-sigma factor [Candidatus Binataceae bacterium]
MTHKQLKELAVLKALDRLEGDEARALDAHLSTGCAECQREIEEFREALAAMAMSEAGNGSADRIWQRLERRLHAVPAGPDLGPIITVRAERPAERIDDRPTRRYSRIGLVAAVGAAAAAVIIAVVLAASYSADEIARVKSDTSERIAALDDRIESLRQDLDSAGAKLAVIQQKLAQTSDLTLASLAPDTKILRLTGLPPAPHSSGLLVLSASRGSAVLQVAGLPPAPEDKIYEVWWIGQQNGPQRAGVFSSGDKGTASVALAMPPAKDVLLASAVTLEPQGGTDKPTGSMYLRGDFPQPAPAPAPRSSQD